MTKTSSQVMMCHVSHLIYIHLDLYIMCSVAHRVTHSKTVSLHISQWIPFVMF